eukprot:8975223-Pyramimonas_sp.AAC.1
MEHTGEDDEGEVHLNSFHTSKTPLWFSLRFDEGGQRRHELGFDEIVLRQLLSAPVELRRLVTRMDLRARDAIPADG